MRFLFLVVMLLTGALPALANDSEAELAVGGLVLIPSAHISLDKEDLYISPKEVRVHYVFTNTSAKDIETLVAFPLPDQVHNEEGDDYFRDFRAELGFETKVDGKPVALDIVEQAFSQGVDITQRVQALGLPLNQRSDPDGFNAKAAAIPAAERQKLRDEGLLLAFEYDAGEGARWSFQPAWDYRMTVTRKQLFPAGKSITVEHRYKPLTGSNMGGFLEPSMRKEEGGKGTHGPLLRRRPLACRTGQKPAAYQNARQDHALQGNLAGLCAEKRCQLERPHQGFPPCGGQGQSRRICELLRRGCDEDFRHSV
jgi:Domain of unknown function (DUF4424)